MIQSLLHCLSGTPIRSKSAQLMLLYHFSFVEKCKKKPTKCTRTLWTSYAKWCRSSEWGWEPPHSLSYSQQSFHSHSFWMSCHCKSRINNSCCMSFTVEWDLHSVPARHLMACHLSFCATNNSNMSGKSKWLCCECEWVSMEHGNLGTDLWAIS